MSENIKKLLKYISEKDETNIKKQLKQIFKNKVRDRLVSQLDEER